MHAALAHMAAAVLAALALLCARVRSAAPS